jgi:A/G-specific adenine glycosylase
MSDDTRRALLAWFNQHKRDLPWRRTHDPYAIWVSEIMLQQTRVTAVLEHYARWMERFPNIPALARAGEAEVLAAWSGLGYYRRARMLHHAAQAVVSEHKGALPRTASALCKLPGIGEYTSAAIASIAFGEPIAVVDGNVERVMTRLGGLAPAPGQAAGPANEASSAEDLTANPAPPGTTAALEPSPPGQTSATSTARAIRALAQQLVSSERPGDSNQAMMELGATVCLPKAPLCLHCPVQPWCRTRGEHVSMPRKPLIARAITYALVRRAADGHILLRQRAADASLMAAMWELPELAEVTADAEVILRLRHAITVTNYLVSIVRLGEEQAGHLAGTWRWVPVSELPELPLTGLARKVLRRLELWPRT